MTSELIAWIDGHRIVIEVQNKDYRDNELTDAKLMSAIKSKLSELKAEIENND